MTRAAVAVSIVVGLAALLAPWLSPFSPLAQHPGDELLGPGPRYLLGTDELGRDLLSRLLQGARTTLGVACAAVAASWICGVSLGLIAGYAGGAVDAVIVRLSDALLAFPRLVVGLATLALLGPGAINVAWALAVDLAPGIVRLTRSLVQVERGSDYVLAAHGAGAGASRIVGRHILPNVLPALLIQASVAFGYAAVGEGSLSFIGLGAQPPDASWGTMLNTARGFLREAPWYGLWPGLAFAVVVLCVNQIADALRDALDPTSPRHSIQISE